VGGLARTQEAELLAHLGHDRDLVAVLQVGADAGSVERHRDAVTLELGAWANARQLQQLGTIEGASRENDLAPRPREKRGSGRVAGIGVGAIEALAAGTLDAD